MIRVLDLEESKAITGEDIFQNVVYAQYCKSAVNFAIYLIAFWYIRTSTLFYVLQVCMFMYILGYFGDTNFNTMNYVMIFILIILVYIVFRWGHSHAVKNLNQINAANF